MAKRRSLLARLLRRALWLALIAAALVVGWAALYRVVDPPTTVLIEQERRRLGQAAQTWRPLSEISPHLARAAAAAEDARFCDHRGFDFVEIEAARARAAAGGRLRGASTISQQTAKNAFLWTDRSWTRKALEAGFTVLIETLWGKRRIMEVYLNVAEFGEGVFGAEAAARRWFDKGADALTPTEAARLAAILPSPRTRNPARPSDAVARRARAIAHGAETLRVQRRDRCFL
ncbi:MAG: monofunctional biosynthetic peptidoglycan transglycosylase [Rhodobacteraceae bacterium]|nr:MAG: monofunctional biosynthetic peptidoglycan transglycosylase [Paracoccaceae bacterium]